jgi:hypothetical protein
MASRSGVRKGEPGNSLKAMRLKLAVDVPQEACRFRESSRCVVEAVAIRDIFDR